MITSAQAVAPTILKTGVSGVTETSAILKAEINPQGKATTYRFEYGVEKCSLGPCASIPIPEASAGEGSSAVPVQETVEGLTPGTLYHFRVIAKNGNKATDRTIGPDRLFVTHGAPSGGLPDNRAYEQSSPVDKDGGDIVGKLGLVKAADDGEGITFGNTFGIPGGKGAQALPSYLALRGDGASGWSTQGLLPPPSFGERAQVQGWLPDFSQTVSNVAKLGSPRTKALVLQSTSGATPIVISPYTAKAEYSYVGATPDASVLFFEAQAKLKTKEGGSLIEAAIDGKPNLYAWDRATGEVSLAGALNNGKAPPKGAIAGPYHWALGTSAQTLREGGAARGYYLQGTHAITSSGDIYFTEAGTGQLFLRINPTQPQSALNGAGNCEDPAKACTIHVSASKRTVPDPAGSQPAAFQAASADGSEVFFTSSEKLTDESNTGPDQPPPAIGLGSVSTGAIEDADFIPKRAIGVAVDSAHIYWADPVGGAIGRADLNGENPDANFIAPGPSECEEEVEPGVVEKVEVPSTPRYVAVDAGHVYWTNTGKHDANGDPVDGGGTIGRADIEGSEASIEPGFICGEVESGPDEREAVVSNPQGIAVNATNIYWANAAKDLIKHAIVKAAIGGGAVEAKFLAPPRIPPSFTPYGVALSGSHVYFAVEDPGPGGDNGYVERVTLDGAELLPSLFVGKDGIRGVALDGAYVYWAAKEEAIGRIPLGAIEPGGCESIATCESKFVEPEGSLAGLAVDASHLYWSTNGESPPNPGNDLYRFEPGTEELEDLTFVPTGKGAEAQGVVGLTDDGSHLYFVANGALSAGATQGDCQGPVSKPPSGSCNLYLLEGGTTTLVARLKGADALDWTGTPRELFSTAGFTPKTSFLSDDGETLLFRSQEQLSEYDNEGVPELYRYRADTQEIACVSCPPSGEAAGKGPSLGSFTYPEPLSPPLASVAMVESRNLSADGNHVFFETAQALVPGDTNGQVSCEPIGSQLTPTCLDTYEWEAPNAGSCKEGGPGYSPLNEGCVFLISTGKSEYPSFFADASESGDDVFFFTRQQLVGQDKDELQDVYDARVGGGLASQNEVPLIPCEGADACRGPLQTPPAQTSPLTPQFVGPGNAVPKHKSQKAKKQKKKHKAKKKSKNKRANAKGRTGR